MEVIIIILSRQHISDTKKLQWIGGSPAVPVGIWEGTGDEPVLSVWLEREVDVIKVGEGEGRFFLGRRIKGNLIHVH